MPVIIDYRIRLDGELSEGSVELSGDLLPKPGDSFNLSVGERNLESVVAEVGELSPRKGRLHLRVRLRDYPVRGMRRAMQWLASALRAR